MRRNDRRIRLKTEPRCPTAGGSMPVVTPFTVRGMPFWPVIAGGNMPLPPFIAARGEPTFYIYCITIPQPI